MKGFFSKSIECPRWGVAILLIGGCVAALFGSPTLLWAALLGLNLSFSLLYFFIGRALLTDEEKAVGYQGFYNALRKPYQLPWWLLVTLFIGTIGGSAYFSGVGGALIAGALFDVASPEDD